MKKKVLALLLVCLMAVSVGLAGCSPQTAAPAEPAAPAEENKEG